MSTWKRGYISDDILRFFSFFWTLNGAIILISFSVHSSFFFLFFQWHSSIFLLTFLLIFFSFRKFPPPKKELLFKLNSLSWTFFRFLSVISLHFFFFFKKKNSSLISSWFQSITINVKFVNSYYSSLHTLYDEWFFSISNAFFLTLLYYVPFLSFYIFSVIQ